MAGKEIIVLPSKYSVSNLPADERCDMCEGELKNSTTTHEFHGRSAIVRIENVPVSRCLGSCGGSWYHPQVTLSFVEAAIPVFERYRDKEMFLLLSKQTSFLSESIKEVAPLIEIEQPK